MNMSLNMNDGKPKNLSAFCGFILDKDHCLKRGEVEL